MENSALNLSFSLSSISRLSEEVSLEVQSVRGLRAESLRRIFREAELAEPPANLSSSSSGEAGFTPDSGGTMMNLAFRSSDPNQISLVRQDSAKSNQSLGLHRPFLQEEPRGPASSNTPPQPPNFGPDPTSPQQRDISPTAPEMVDRMESSFKRLFEFKIWEVS